MGSSVSKVLHHKAAASVSVKPKAPSKTKQSPIDIVQDPATEPVTLSSSDNVLHLGSASAELELVNWGDNFQVNWNNHDENFLVLNGKKFYTVQFHFHAPSEHTVGGNARAMELHLVHQAEDGALAVVGIFFREGEHNIFLAQFWDEIATLKLNKHDHVMLGKISGGDELNSLLDGQIFRYSGSLTTPPYTEDVAWVVVNDMLEASDDQLNVFRKFLPRPNARDTQKLNGRSVALCQCSNASPIGA